MKHSNNWFAEILPNGKLRFHSIVPNWKIAEHFIDYSPDDCSTARIYVRDLLELSNHYRYKWYIEPTVDKIMRKNKDLLESLR